MNKKSLIILIIILVVIAILGVVYFKIKKPEPILNPSNTATPGSETTSPVENANIITIENFSFNPPVLKIKAGEKAIWKHNDSAVHSVIGAIFQSNTLNRGGEFSFVFPAAGEYNYHCGIHPSMKGKIIVE